MLLPADAEGNSSGSSPAHVSSQPQTMAEFPCRADDILDDLLSSKEKSLRLQIRSFMVRRSFAGSCNGIGCCQTQACGNFKIPIISFADSNKLQ